MNKNYLYLFLVFAFTGVFATCNMQPKRSMPSLTETFAKTDTKPFGAYIAYSQVENMFPQNIIRAKKQPFTKTWIDISDTASLYICITPTLYVNDEEIKAMLAYVYAGNSLFLAANYIDDDLMKEIKCTLNNNNFSNNINFFDSLRNTNSKFNDSAFAYFYLPFKNYFFNYDTLFTKVLGVNEKKQPNYMLFFHGKGKLFLHCEPKTFSNYFLLKNDNYKYLQTAFSYTNNKPQNLYWDDYYRNLGRRRSNREPKSFSSLSEILKHPPLAAAFWLSLLLLLLYILFGIKRRQRIIEKRKGNENTTVTFTETIGRLYLQKKDNKNIAEKMSAYFNEYVRNNYFLNTNTINDDFITSLSRKSGVAREKTDALYRAIQHAHQSEVVDDYQLLSLNEQIQNFFKKQ